MSVRVNNFLVRKGILYIQLVNCRHLQPDNILESPFTKFNISGNIAVLLDITQLAEPVSQSVQDQYLAELLKWKNRISAFVCIAADQHYEMARQQLVVAELYGVQVAMFRTVNEGEDWIRYALSEEDQFAVVE